jgi:uncharacterized membrane protein YeiH
MTGAAALAAETSFAVPHAVDLAAVAVGAVQGAVFAERSARRQPLDVVGIATVGILTGLGGGMLRDVLLNEIPLALDGDGYILTAVVAAFAGFMMGSLVNRWLGLVVAVDAASLGLFMLVGTLKASNGGLAVVPCMFIGVVAAVGGSVLRDVLLRTEVGVVQVGSFYAVAAAAGAATFVTLDRAAGVPAGVAGPIGVAVTFSVRMAALWFGWTTPRADRLPRLPPLRTVRRSHWPERTGPATEWPSPPERPDPAEPPS